MHRWDALNARQQAVLHRIAAGEDLGGPANTTGRRSASALRDRGLVTITKRHGWRATLTDAGRYYIEHGCHPEHPNAPVPMRVDRHGQAVPPKPTHRAGPKIDNSKNAGIAAARPRRSAPHRTLEIAEKRRAAATELITKLTSEGPLSIHNPDNVTITEWRCVIDFAKRNGLVPEGKRIVKNRPCGRHLKIELVEGAHPNARPDPSLAPPITVPERTDSWHPLLRGLAAKNHRLRVSSDSLDRTLRILHALLTAAHQRGYQAEWADDHGDALVFTTSDHRHELVLYEEYDSREVLPTTDELATKKTYSWQRIQPEWKSLPTGKLRIQLTTGYEYSGRPRTWADRQRRSLEDKLGDVLAEIEARTRLAEERARAAEEARAARRREWETAMTTARRRFHDDRRAAALTEQVTAWDRTVRIRAYCDAQDKAIADNPDLADRLAQWLAWCRSYADRIDPIGRWDLEPEHVEPRREDLRPNTRQRSSLGIVRTTVSGGHSAGPGYATIMPSRNRSLRRTRRN